MGYKTVRSFLNLRLILIIHKSSIGKFGLQGLLLVPQMCSETIVLISLIPCFEGLEFGGKNMFLEASMTSSSKTYVTLHEQNLKVSFCYNFLL